MKNLLLLGVMVACFCSEQAIAERFKGSLRYVYAHGDTTLDTPLRSGATIARVRKFGAGIYLLRLRVKGGSAGRSLLISQQDNHLLYGEDARYIFSTESGEECEELLQILLKVRRRGFRILASEQRLCSSKLVFDNLLVGKFR